MVLIYICPFLVQDSSACYLCPADVILVVGLSVKYMGGKNYINEGELSHVY